MSWKNSTFGVGEDVLNQLKAREMVGYIKDRVVKETKLRTRILPYDLKQANAELETAKEDPSLFFRDGRRRIDMVLAYVEEDLDDPDGGPPVVATVSGASSPNGVSPKRSRTAVAAAAAAGALTRSSGDDHLDSDERRREARATFEENLMVSGLELEYEDAEDSFDMKTSFVKIHAPDLVLDRSAEIIGMKAPVKEFIVTYYSSREPKHTSPYRNGTWLLGDGVAKTVFNCATIPPEPNIFNSGFLPDILDKYVLKERTHELSNIQRTQIVWQVLTRVRYDNASRDKAGIARLMAKNVYSACYPLHEGECDYGDPDKNAEMTNHRRILYQEWASLRNWYKQQPLWLIRRYFGVKIGLYFAWLGFYTKFLVIPSVVGVVCFLFGCATIGTELNRASLDICDDAIMGNTTMCPQCDLYCPYWKLHDSCPLSKVTYLFDNAATVFFAIFMSVWATTFLELWKRRQAILQWEWDLHSEDEEDEIRPEYEQGVKSLRLNPITQKREPYVTAKEKVMRLSLTWSVVLVMLTAVIGAVFSVLVFRLVVITFMYKNTKTSRFFSRYAKMVATGFAASINAAVIEMSGVVFQIIARKITNWEHPRTQADYENSYTFKMFLFQFINYYSSLVYTAFFKGRFFTYPGDAGQRNDLVSRMKMDMCDPAGCLYELCLMLTIYMIGRQFVSNSMELYFPKFKNWFRKYLYSYRLRSMLGAVDEEDRARSASTIVDDHSADVSGNGAGAGNGDGPRVSDIVDGDFDDAEGRRVRRHSARSKEEGEEEDKATRPHSHRRASRALSMASDQEHHHQKPKLKRWEADYQLEEIDRLHLFDEYIEMVIQYGFVTLFVAAFPLAPLLALINNIFEIRLDAYKYTVLMRRPLGQQVRDIGIWYGILEGMTYLSVVFNAFVIALTSDFIPKMVYLMVHSEDYNLKGYINSTLSVFNTSDWGAPGSDTYYGPEMGANETEHQYETCRYLAYREPPDHHIEEERYSINKVWLHVFAARLGFIVIFEHFVLVLNSVLAYAIPDIPNNLSTQLLRERQTKKEIQFQFDGSSPSGQDTQARSAEVGGGSRAGVGSADENCGDGDLDIDDMDGTGHGQHLTVSRKRSSAGNYRKSGRQKEASASELLERMASMQRRGSRSDLVEALRMQQAAVNRRNSTVHPMP